MEQSYDNIYKSMNSFSLVILVGDAAVGKTCLLSRYIKGTIPKQKMPTVGVEFATKAVEMNDGARVKAQLWDTAGQEKYRAITSAYINLIGRHYRKAVGGLVVYDITKKASFENAERWVKDLKANAEPNIIITLVGNKLDLCEEDPRHRQVTPEEGRKFAEKHELLFKESSAFQDLNVKDAFEELLQST